MTWLKHIAKRCLLISDARDGFDLNRWFPMVFSYIQHIVYIYVYMHLITYTNIHIHIHIRIYIYMIWDPALLFRHCSFGRHIVSLSTCLPLGWGEAAKEVWRHGHWGLSSGKSKLQWVYGHRSNRIMRSRILFPASMSSDSADKCDLQT